MRKINGIYEEKEEEKFRKVPIEDMQNNSIEIYNVYSGIDSPKEKCRRKIYNIIMIILILFIVFMIYRILKITNLINDDEEPNMNNDFDFNNDDDEDEAYKKYNEDEDEAEYFYLEQNKKKATFNFSSPQLRKAKNIKLIEKLQISLNLEYDKFVHLKIKDANNKRWEVPEKDILDKEYILNINDNKIEITKYNDNYDNDNFYIELLTKDSNNEQNDMEDNGVDPDNINNKIKEVDNNSNINEEFGFRLMTNHDEEFYYFSTSDNFLFSETFINFRSKLTSDNIYGFGERIHDFKLNEGTYTIWPNGGGTTKYDDGKGGMNQYSHQPIGLHKTKYNGLWLGFVFLNTNAQDVVIHSDKNTDNKKNTYLSHRTIGGIINYYIIVDDSPEEIIKDINMLLGVPPLPPFWSLGYHQSGQGYNSFDNFNNVYERLKGLEIPFDGMWLDADSLDNYEMFTINEKFKGIIPYIESTIHKDKGKFIPIVDIGFSYENKEKQNPYIKLGEELDIFIKSNYTKENLIGKTLAGKVVFPDFFNPNITEFWNKGLENYYNLVKYDGIWLDMNEPTNLLDNNKNLKLKCAGEIVEEEECTPDKNLYNNDDLPYIPGYRDDIKEIKETLSLKSISENALIYGNNTIYDTKPMISFYQTKYTYDFLSSYLHKRPFILSRSTSIGSGKYAFHWLGDNLRTFDNLKNSVSGIFNFNIFGIPFTGSDIYGFVENSSKNMCLRWFNLGIFYPFLRNYNYHWSYQTEVLNVIKKNIKLRYSLLRYIYSQFFLISLNERAGFFKPLMIEFPDDEASFEDIESKIMFGESFLLCAFYDNNELSKKFKFPNANFNYYQTGKSLVNYNEENNENKIIELSGKTDEIHLFLRGGFIVPYQNTIDKYILNSQKLRNEKINLIVNVDNDNQSKGIIFFDNNDNDVIKNNTYYRVDLFYEDKKLSFTTFKNNLEKYNFNDHILGKIEFWRISQQIEINNEKENKTKIVSLKIEYKDNSFSGNIEGVYLPENDKIVFDISNEDKKISIFDIDEMELI